MKAKSPLFDSFSLYKNGSSLFEESKRCFGVGYGMENRMMAIEYSQAAGSRIDNGSVAIRVG